jgi:CheY-like chemotaxis protein
MKRLVLFVDDDRYYAYSWIEVLRSDFNVEHRRDPLSALLRAQTLPEIDCIVLDVMMPTPEGVGASETADGFETGLWFLEKLVIRIKDLPIPVIVLTNRELNLIQARIDNLRFQKGLVEVRRKLDVGTDMLKQIVHDLVSRWRR